jgi:copper(I)-binding protein
MPVARKEQEGRLTSASPPPSTEDSPKLLNGARPDRRRLGQVIRVLVAVGALNLLVGLGDAYADAPPLSLGNEIQVENAYATSGPVGGSTEVRFRLVNESGTTVVLLGVSSRIAENSRLIARIGASDTTELQSISVLAGEVLDLTTSHLWYELFPLRNKLETGDVFDLELDLVNARVMTDVHVH